MRGLVVLWVVVVLAVGMAGGQPAEVPTDVEQAIRELGDPSFQVRQHAQQALAEIGWPAKTALERATKNPDPEIAASARKLLAGLLPGVTGKTPPGQRELVVAYMRNPQISMAGDPVTQLAYQKPVPHAILLALLEWEQDWAQRQAILKDIWPKVQDRFPELLAASKSDVYEQYLGWAIQLDLMAAIPQIAAYAYRDGKLDELRERVAARVASNPTEFSRRLLVEILVLAGCDDQAIAVAKPLDDWSFLEELLIRTCAWKELACQIQQREPEPGGLPLVRLAAAQRLAGDEEESVRTLARVMAYDGDGNGVRLVEAAGETATAGRALGLREQQGLERHYVIPEPGGTRAALFVRQDPKGSGKREASYCLLAFGFTGDAVQVFLNEGDWKQAVIILNEQRRYGEAARVLQAWESRASPEDRWRWVVRRAAVLRTVGDPAGRRLAAGVLDQCCDGRLGERTPELVGSVTAEVRWAGYRDLADERLPDLMAGFGGQKEEAARELVQGADWTNAGFWWDRLAELDPGTPPESRMVRLREFLTDRMPDPEAEQILRGAVHPDDPPTKVVSALVAVARVCARRGWSRQAKEAAREARHRAERVGEWGGDQWVPGYACFAANTCFGPDADWHELADAYRCSGQDGKPELLVAAANYSAWQGDREAGRRLVDEAIRKTLPEEWDGLLSDMTDGDWEGYERLLPVAAVQTDHIASDTLDAAVQARDYGLVLRLAQRQWYGEAIPSPGSFRWAGGVMWMNAELALAESQRLIADGRLTEGLAKARAGVAQHPDITWRLICVRQQLASADVQDEGDTLAQWGLDFHQRVLDLFPDAVESLRSFAWLSAWTGLEVENGEKCIQRAIEQNPGRSDLVEALAMFSYRKGDTSRGIELMRKCVRMAPSSRHLNRLGRWLERERKKAAEEQ